MKIQNSKGEVIQVPRHLEKTVKQHIKKGNHQAVSQMFTPQNPQGMQEGPISQPNGMMFADGGYLRPVPGVVYEHGWYPYPAMGYGGQLPENEEMQAQDQDQSVPINVEGSNKAEGTKYQMAEGELLVNNGKIVKNYIHRPPHPTEGTNSDGDVTEQKGLIVIPKKRSREYENADMRTRRAIEKSLTSQQDHRLNKHIQGLRKEGGLTLPFYAKGGEVKCDSCEDKINSGETYGKGGWIQKAIKHPGRCSSPGDKRCPKGSPQYNLAMRFKHGDLKHGDGGYTALPSTTSVHSPYLQPIYDTNLHSQSVNTINDFRKTYSDHLNEVKGKFNVDPKYVKSVQEQLDYYNSLVPKKENGGQVGDSYPIGMGMYKRGGLIYHEGRGLIPNTTLSHNGGAMLMERQPQHSPYRNGGRIKMLVGGDPSFKKPFMFTGDNSPKTNSLNYDSPFTVNPEEADLYSDVERMDKYNNSYSSTNGQSPWYQRQLKSNSYMNLPDSTTERTGYSAWREKPKSQFDFQRAQNTSDVMQGIGVTSNILRGAFEPTSTYSPTNIKPLGYKEIPGNLGYLQGLKTYRTGQAGATSLPEKIARESLYRDTEQDRVLGIAARNVQGYEQYAGRTQAADEFNAQQRMMAWQAKQQAEAAKKAYLSQGLADLGKLGQNRMNNELYNEYLQKFTS